MNKIEIILIVLIILILVLIYYNNKNSRYRHNNRHNNKKNKISIIQSNLGNSKLQYSNIVSREKFNTISNTIPKNIYMCYKTKDIPPNIMTNWKNLNPDYNIYLYDNKMCIDFLNKYYNKMYVDIFNYIKDGPIKSDFWRVCILYEFGGVYCDVDIKPIVPIKDFMEKGVTFLTCISQDINSQGCHDINPHLIICPPKHHVLKITIDKYISMYQNDIKYSYLKWSIVPIFTNIFTNMFTCIKNDGIYNTKYQFLKEVDKNTTAFDNIYCYYKNKIILYNRDKSYNSKLHKFKV